MKMRLQKILAEAGVTSRRKAEDFIVQGRVEVNGIVTDRLGSKADPEIDEIRVNGRLVRYQKKVYIMLNKPPGYISSRSKKEGKSVMHFMKKVKQRVYPVGRLDKDSEGLIILTNDGDYALQMTHPRFEHEKEYLVELDAPLKAEYQPSIKRGPTIHGVKLAPMKILALGKNGREVRIVLKEGKKRQLRRVFGKFGYAVVSLKRVRIGRLTLGDLKLGQWKYFDPEDSLNL